jgi:hypothetical protein
MTFDIIYNNFKLISNKFFILKNGYAIDPFNNLYGMQLMKLGILGK